MRVVSTDRWPRSDVRPSPSEQMPGLGDQVHYRRGEEAFYGPPTPSPLTASRGPLTVPGRPELRAPCGLHTAQLSTATATHSAESRGYLRRPLVVSAALCGALLLASCSATGTEPTAASGPASVASSSSSVRSTAPVGSVPPTTAPRWSVEQQAVVDAYREAMRAFDIALADPPNPDVPALGATTIDPALGEVRRLAQQWHGFGQALKYPTPSVHRIEPLSVSIDGAIATIVTCNVDDGVIYEPASGRTLNDKVTTARDEATLSLVGGVWKLTTRVQQQKWEGVAGCVDTSSS